MQNRQSTRNVHIIIHSLSKSLRNLTARLQQILSCSKERLNTLNSGCRLLQRRRTVIKNRTIMRTTEVVTNHQRARHFKHLRRRNRITDRLRHLLTLKGDHAVMHPEVRKIITGSSRLRQLILMVRETQIQTATVNIETRTQILTRHRRALQMPARTAATPRRLPRSSQRLALLIALPQGKITRVTLTARISIRRILHILNALIRQRTILIPRTHIKIHVTRIIQRRIRVATINQTLNQSKHLRNMTGRARLIRRRINTQRRIRLSKNLLKTVRERPPLLIRELTLKTRLHRISRLRQNLVINISDIADRRHLQTAVTHPTAQLVKNQRRTDMAQMRFTLHRSTTIIDTRLTGHDGLKLANSRGS